MPRFAHFDADDPLEGGLCLSVFLVSVDEGGVLAGTVGDAPEWSSLDRVAGSVASLRGRWVLPASHLLLGEDPAAAARRVARDQLGADLERPALIRVLSFAAPLPERAQDLHWDLCFVYDGDVDLGDPPPWFGELRRLPREALERVRFARGHDDVLRGVGLLPPAEAC